MPCTAPRRLFGTATRIEIRNAGYSLKDPSRLGTPSSHLRNPVIAAVLHDLHLAEAKGTGIRAMRRLSADAGLPLPEIHSDRQANEFKITLFLRNLLTDKEHAWLRGFAGEGVGADEAKTLLYARETGAVDNAACRDFCGLDTLSASQMLRRLRDKGLLRKKGAGSRTYYVLAQEDATRSAHAEGGAELATFPPELATLLAQLKKRSPARDLRQAIVHLCALAPLTVEQLALLLGKNRDYLRNKHLIPMVNGGQLRFRYPESAKHPRQAYMAATDKNEAP